MSFYGLMMHDQKHAHKDYMKCKYSEVQYILYTGKYNIIDALASALHSTHYPGKRSRIYWVKITKTMKLNYQTINNNKMGRK